MFLVTGITQERIDECRGAKEREMVVDVRALIERGADLNVPDDNGATLVRERTRLFTARFR